MRLTADRPCRREGRRAQKSVGNSTAKQNTRWLALGLETPEEEGREQVAKSISEEITEGNFSELSKDIE